MQQSVAVPAPTPPSDPISDAFYEIAPPWARRTRRLASSSPPSGSQHEAAYPRHAAFPFAGEIAEAAGHFELAERIVALTSAARDNDRASDAYRDGPT